MFSKNSDFDVGTGERLIMIKQTKNPQARNVPGDNTCLAENARVSQTPVCSSAHLDNCQEARPGTLMGHALSGLSSDAAASLWLVHPMAPLLCCSG